MLLVNALFARHATCPHCAARTMVVAGAIAQRNRDSRKRTFTLSRP